MQPIISIKNLYKNYGNKQILKGIDVDIYPGEIIGYIGPNGAGKSTTVKVLTGLITDYDGTIIIKGIDLKCDTQTVKSYIGYVPELAELYDVLTPKEFLHFIGSLYNLEKELIDNRMVKMLSAFGLKDNIDERMDSFSKGMRQKVLITAGLIHNPDIIILDEPLSGLDANSVIIIKELISKLAKDGKTIFYCSHMMDVVERVSDRIIVIDEGKIIADGSFETLQQQLGSGGSLENIFASLTANNSSENAADALINAFK